MEKNTEKNNTTCGVIALITMGMLILYGVGAAIFYVTLQNISLTFDTVNQSIETLNHSINNIHIIMTMDAAQESQNPSLETSMPVLTEETTPTANITATHFPQKPTLTPLAAVATSSLNCDCDIQYTCNEFESPEKAQSCFTNCGGSPANNWSDLDPDHDGKACQPVTTYP